MAFKSCLNKGGFKQIKEVYRSFPELTLALREASMESSQIILAFDFSKSNEWSGEKTYQRSLHDITQETPYEKVCRLLIPVITSFDSDSIIPAIRFGCSVSKDQIVCPLNPYSKSPECQGFAEVLHNYREAVKMVKLSGPTSLSPVVRYAINIVKKTREYHILIILTDDDPVSSVADADTVAEASNYPLSIVAVGLGDGPFKILQSFDTQYYNRRFDNFHFVNFTELETKFIHSNRPDLLLATELFVEIPKQYQIIRKLGLL